VSARDTTGAPAAPSEIEVRGLVKRFGANEVLHGVDLSVETGEVLAIVGPSGSGKTTLLRCLNLLETPSGGRIRVGDIEIDGAVPPARQKQRVRALRQRVGFVFQSFNLFPHRTALENVIEGPVIVKHEPRAAAEVRGRALLAKVGLAEKADAYPSRLSGGQQQRVAIARALAMEPEVLLFDEPTSALDPELVGEVLAAIRALAAERRTMIIVTHEMTFARDVADRAIVMDEGRIVEQGPARDVFTAPREERTRRFLSKFLDNRR
jgi:cystine transport system ATP-binding protein